jgi:hypothetical protein
MQQSHLKSTQAAVDRARSSADATAPIQVQRELVAANQWIMDGDLGPYDAPAAEPALQTRGFGFWESAVMVADWFGLNGRRELLDEAARRAGRYVEDV